MNILVTGANGQLGNEMRIVAKNSSCNFLFTDVSEQDGVETTYLDITNLEDIRKIVRENNINVIVNCAAWTNVDACETDSKLAELAEKLNAKAPENLAIAMKEVETMCLAKNHTMSPVLQIRRVPLQVSMERQSCMVNKILWRQGVSM